MNEKGESRQTLLFWRHRLRTYNEQYFAVYLLFVTAKCRHIRKAAGIAYAELSGDSGKKEIGFRFCQM